ncbi:purine nucleoside permease [Dictyobacter aurantiacus]|uniref:Purine nucleoside permease n=1 Tax=Dictyobacter aurantiacus TaxID=1936993 RepID=A0A401ZL46_9CHLR|nr:purine nucleoside permease [Dictyobacter aurantiacus]GCE07534.1 hypothetical protein KDAU_48630 [Dictyobacter aurantiacus]
MRTKFLRQGMLAVCLSLCLLGTFTSGLVQAQASPGKHKPQHPFAVKVFIITMFSGEATRWQDHEHFTLVFNVPGADNPVQCNVQRLCLTITGVDKSNAAASMSAILADTRFDFQNTYFITAGTASTPPRSTFPRQEAGTLGFTAWADWVVDWDQGFHQLPGQISDPFGYIPPKTTFPDSTSVYQLNSSLVSLAYHLTANLALKDSPEAIAERNKYPSQVGKKPFVAQCDTDSGDNLWKGLFFSQLAQHIMDLLTDNQGHNCTYNQEDAATATSLKRFGYLNHYLDLRGASAFYTPPPGETLEDFITRSPRTNDLAFDNLYLVGSTVAHYLMGLSTSE